jgi:hypothetical protein
MGTRRGVPWRFFEREGCWGFCWAAHYPSPCGRWLFVDGCVWAAPYELVLFDFGAPLALPYPELGRWPIHTVHGWQADGAFVFEYTVEVRRSDDVPLDQLLEAERGRRGAERKLPGASPRAPLPSVLACGRADGGRCAGLTLTR